MPNLNLTAKVILSALLSALLTSVTAFFVYRNLGQVESAEKMVVHTYKVIDTFKSVESFVERMSGVKRGWLMTGDPQALENYRAAVKDFDETVAEGQRLVSDNPVQVARFDKISELQKEWVKSSAERYVELRKQYEAR
jgi:CHASE3 domain sensor protein